MTWGLPLPPTPPELSHRHWHTVELQRMETCETESRNVLLALSPSSCRCGESQQRWNQGLWFANWSWASSPAESVWLHTGFHRCLSQGRSMGYSSHRAHLRSQTQKQECWNQTKETTSWGTQTWVVSYLFWKGEQAQMYMAELQHLCTNIGTIRAESPWGKLCCYFHLLVFLKRLSLILMISTLLLLLMGVSC